MCTKYCAKIEHALELNSPFHLYIAARDPNHVSFREAYLPQLASKCCEASRKTLGFYRALWFSVYVNTMPHVPKERNLIPEYAAKCFVRCRDA